MRAWEFFREAMRSPIISLRHVNKLKHVKLARQKAQDKRQELFAVMYSSPTTELQYIELQKARVELAQQKAALALTQAETAQANKEAVTNMARSGIETRHANQEKMKKMAMLGIDRRKKR